MYEKTTVFAGRTISLNIKYFLTQGNFNQKSLIKYKIVCVWAPHDNKEDRWHRAETVFTKNFVY